MSCVGCGKDPAAAPAAPKKRTSIIKAAARRVSRSLGLSSAGSQGDDAIAIDSAAQQVAAAPPAPAALGKVQNLVRRSTSSSQQRTSARALASRIDELVREGARPADVAGAYVELGALRLAMSEAQAAAEAFAFALSYSPLKLQAAAYMGLARAHLMTARKQGKGKRGAARESALKAVGAALKLSKRFGDSAGEAEAIALQREVEQLPFTARV